MLSFNRFLKHVDEEMKKDPCWTGYKMIGTKKKGGKEVPNCVPTNEEKHRILVTISDPLHSMVSQRKEKIQKHVRVAADDKESAQKKAKDHYLKRGYKVHNTEHVGMVNEEELSIDEQFDLIEELVTSLATEHNVDPETIWEEFEAVDDIELLEAAVDAKGHKSSTGGLTQKGRDYYNNKTGGNLKAPVTTPPSKLDPDSKAAKRRKSFCARMSGNPGPMKDEKGRPTRKALALRKWNC